MQEAVQEAVQEAAAVQKEEHEHEHELRRVEVIHRTPRMSPTSPTTTKLSPSPEPLGLTFGISTVRRYRHSKTIGAASTTGALITRAVRAESSRGRVQCG